MDTLPAVMKDFLQHGDVPYKGQMYQLQKRAVDKIAHTQYYILTDYIFCVASFEFVLFYPTYSAKVTRDGN